MSEQNFSFRQANDLDIKNIYSWLIDHDHREVHGSFLCN